MQKEAFEPTGLIPRSIIRTFDRFLQQLLPGSENVAIQEYRVSRYQILVSIQSLFVLVCIPFFVNYAVKCFLLTPLTEHFWNSEQKEIFLNAYQEKRAFAEMQDFSEKIFFESLLRDNQPNDRLDLMQLELLSSSPYQTLLSQTKGLNNGLERQALQSNRSYYHNRLELPCQTQERLNKNLPILNEVAATTSPFLGIAKVFRPTGCDGVVNKDVISLSARAYDQNYFDLINSPICDVYTPSVETPSVETPSGEMSSVETRAKAIRANVCKTATRDLHALAPKAALTTQTPYRNQRCKGQSLNLKPATNLKPALQVSSRLVGGYTEVCMGSFAHNTAVKPFSILDQSCKLFTSNVSAPLPAQNITSYGNWDTKATSAHRDDKGLVSNSGITFTHQPPQGAWASVYGNKNALVDQRSCNESFLWQEEYNLQKQFQLKSLQIASRYNQQSILAITNTCADFISICTLYLLSVLMKPQIIILKSFLIESIYSLSDTTKSFLLILGMDLLVGFHSPRGWEIALETLLRHFGLPENENFILLFVALFPVFLDTVFKYWIFRYLNKISPSTVVTYHSMLE